VHKTRHPFTLARAMSYAATLQTVVSLSAHNEKVVYSVAMSDISTAYGFLGKE
jgi:hypothetical protein